ncbi:MAG: LysM peptidoglycan-binding domain-containing protein [Kiritimatiellia bacterium]
MNFASHKVNKFVCHVIITGFAVHVLAAASFAGPEIHTVKKGESLDRIARSYDVNVEDLIRENNIEKPSLIQPGQKLTIPARPGAPVKYVVQKGDTLEEIALEHASGVGAIMSANNIADPKKLQIGQELSIPVPGPGGTLSEAVRYPLPNDIRQAIDGAPVKAGRWKHIVIHHSASKSGSLKSFDAYHRQKRRMENGLAYHFVIGNGQSMPDGEIGIGDRWKKQLRGGHLTSDAQNEIALGICLVGNFDVSKPTDAQMKSLHALVRHLMRRCGVPGSEVKTHREINIKPTACPGKHFPIKTFRGQL